MSRTPLRIAIALSLLVLCLYSQFGYTKRHSSISQIRERPERYENVSFRSEGRVNDVRLGPETRFRLLVMGESVEAIYPKRFELRDGDYVIVYGELHMTKGYLLVTKLHVYRNILRLYVLSFVGLGAVVLLFLRDWSLDPAALLWRRRNA